MPVLEDSCAGSASEGSLTAHKDNQNGSPISSMEKPTASGLLLQATSAQQLADWLILRKKAAFIILAFVGFLLQSV